MKCINCKDSFELSEADISTKIIKQDGEEKIDLEVTCCNCGEMVSFAFVSEKDLILNRLIDSRTKETVH